MYNSNIGMTAYPCEIGSRLLVYAMLSKMISFCMVLMLGVSVSLSAQNFNGHWSGTLSKIDGTAFHKTLDLIQTGSSVRGTSRSVVVEDTACYIVYAVEGELKQGKLFLEETEVLEEESFNQWYWCTKISWLDWEYTDSTMVLKGTWKANGPSYYRGKMTIGPCEPQTVKGDMSVSRPLKEASQSRGLVPDLLQARLLNPVDTVFLSAKAVKLTVWDDLEADGDIISLYVDGEWILREHLIGAEALEINMEVSEHSYLVLHAESIGNTYPNTAAISFEAAEQEQNIKLRSSFEESHLIVFSLSEKP